MDVTHSPPHKSALSVNTPSESCDSVSVTLDFINTPPPPYLLLSGSEVTGVSDISVIRSSSSALAASPETPKGHFSCC